MVATNHPAWDDCNSVFQKKPRCFQCCIVMGHSAEVCVALAINQCRHPCIDLKGLPFCRLDNSLSSDLRMCNPPIMIAMPIQIHCCRKTQAVCWYNLVKFTNLSYRTSSIPSPLGAFFMVEIMQWKPNCLMWHQIARLESRSSQSGASPI